MMTAEFTTTVMIENQQWIDWKTKNNKTIDFIMFNITSEIDVHIENETTMKKMWEKLHKLYNIKEFNFQYILQNSLYDCQLNQFAFIDKYVSKFKKLVKTLAEQQYIIDNKEKIIFFLINLEFFYSL